jgi:hypothetical protein
MKNKIISPKQQGQAIVEMCVCLIPILVVMLGMIFISGLGISNIKAFIEAKENAELNSRNPNAIGGAGDNIYYWDYGNAEVDEEGDGYPFTADDQIVSFYQTGTETGTETLINQQLNDAEYSQENTQGYRFMRTTNLISIDSDYMTMVDTADLVRGTADSNLNSVFTLDSNEMDNVRDVKFSFTYLFGVDVDDLKLHEMRANEVYYPALPTQ